MAERLIEFRSRNVLGKFGNMRKVQTFCVYPQKAGESFIIAQSHRSIVRIDLETGKGLWNPKGQYFPFLSPAMGAMEVELPEEFVEKCRAVASLELGKE